MKTEIWYLMTNALFEVCIVYEDGSLDIRPDEANRFKMTFRNRLYNQS